MNRTGKWRVKKACINHKEWIQNIEDHMLPLWLLCMEYHKTRERFCYHLCCDNTSVVWHTGITNISLLFKVASLVYGKLYVAIVAPMQINPHPVIRGLWGPGRHDNCHYLKNYFNLVMGFHVILTNFAWYRSWMFLYSVAELIMNILVYSWRIKEWTSTFSMLLSL